jgi:thymidine kinase
MSKLHFFYGVMGASKSVQLITQAYNNQQNDIKTLVFKPISDTRQNGIRSRIGAECAATAVHKIPANIIIASNAQFVLIDEIQFFPESDVDKLVDLADAFGVNIFCYGLMTNIHEQIFPTSRRLIEVGATLHRMDTNCQAGGCLNRATHNARFNADGTIDLAGDVLKPGAADYKSLCRKHYTALRCGNTIRCK